MNQVRGSHMRAFKAERIKIKRTGIIWMCLSAAAFIPIITTIAFFFIEIPITERAEGISQMFIEGCFQGFTGFFYPLFLIIFVTRIVYMEHRSDTWKLLETQPVSRFAIFIAKWEIAILVSLLCLVLLFLFAYLGSFIVFQFKYRKLVSQDAIEWNQNIKFIIRLWIASLGLISLQYFIALLIKNFAWPLIIGLTSLIAGSILTRYDMFYWFPYASTSLTSASFKGSNTGSFFIPHEILSIVWSVLLLFMAFQIFLRKKFDMAFLRPLKRLAITIAILGGFGFLFWYINKPVVINRYDKTVFSGSIKSDKPIPSVIIFKPPTYDTVAVIPMVNGKFHGILPNQLEHQIYIVRVGNSNLQVFFGGTDSLHLEWNITKKNSKSPQVSGTRIAENTFLLENRSDYELNFLAESASWYNANEFSSQVLAKWKRGMDRIDDFKTVDNIKPASDFIDLRKKLLAVDLLSLTEISYPKSFAIYYPNDTLKYTPRLKELQKVIDFNQEELASYQSYRQYVSTLIQKNAMESESPYIEVLSQSVKSEKLRNFLALDAIQKSMAVIRDSARRWVMLQSLLPVISDRKIQLSLLEQNDRLNKLQRGKKAPDVRAENVRGTDVALGDLANKYLVIDVWATWCGPCKEQDPYFEQFAEQYTSDKVAFISISVDQDKDAWRMQAPQKSKQVLQLWAKNGGADFMKEYSIGAIPRFILIDPKGYILSVQLPHPSDPQFEEQLQKEIPALRTNFMLPF